MQSNSRHARQRLRRALLGYLATHPGAADGVSGIRLWWLPRDLQDVSDIELDDALGDLVERNEMRRTVLPDGSSLYARIPCPPPLASVSSIRKPGTH